MSQREFKDALYEQFARIGHAFSSAKRFELLDLLAQGEKTVEELAAQIATPIKNTSAHLRVLRQARLVETRRDGTFVYYRLGDDSVSGVLHALQLAGQRRLAEVGRITALYLDHRDTLEPVTSRDLRRRLREGDVTLLDVRPREEFAAGHIPGAISMPLGDLKRHYQELPVGRDVVAYCRGPYCVYSFEAVTFLRQHGFRARRATVGVPEWRAEGNGIATGAEDPSSGSRTLGSFPKGTR